MTTLIFVENVLGSGQVVKLTEDFGSVEKFKETFKATALLQPEQSQDALVVRLGFTA